LSAGKNGDRQASVATRELEAAAERIGHEIVAVYRAMEARAEAVSRGLVEAQIGGRFRGCLVRLARKIGFLAGYLTDKFSFRNLARLHREDGPERQRSSAGSHLATWITPKTPFPPAAVYVTDI
jgi:hypothetical protein